MKKILLSIAIVFTVFVLTATPVHAKCALTSILGGSACNQNGEKQRDLNGDKQLKAGEYLCSCEDGTANSIISILDIVVNVLTIGVGILGVVGISIVGIQYLTAGGNEEKTRTAKRRMLEIIIGLALYAVMYALLQWLGISD